MSRTLSTNSGSVLNFQVWTKCGLSPNARQIRLTADCDMPVAAAIDRVDQCVSCPGPRSSRVLAITSSTCASVTVRGAPGRGSSCSPSSRAARNRARHLVTVGRDTPSATATFLFGVPSAHASTIRDRIASACAVFRRRAHPSKTCRSSALSTSGASFGLPTPEAYYVQTNLRLRTLASLSMRGVGAPRSTPPP
jgi:hypothetical protein